jgi:CubicO group peptidase (beta-lactamase class C family)
MLDDLFFCIVALDDSVRKHINKYIRKQMKKQKISGLSLAIIQNNNLIYGKGYGYSNIELQVPVKLETMFQSASMGKQFTSMAIMILVEREKIDLDTPIKEYIEDTPKEWKNITVRHLLTHTSGMIESPGDFDYQKDITEDDMLEFIKTIPLDFKPGEKFLYSNIGYITLGILIRKVIDEFYGDFIHDNIFEPLGMKTARVISESDIVANRASGYELDDGEIKNQEWVAPSQNTFAYGSLYLNMYDMVKWEKGLNTKTLLKDQSSFDEMWTPVKLNNDTTYPYGFAWGLDETVSGMRVVKHSGVWQGFASMIIRVLDAKVTVVVFANLDDAYAEEIASHVLEIYDSQLALKYLDDVADEDEDENEDEDEDEDEDE